MKTERNILIAFILNMCFSVFEFVGGIFTGSVAITADAVHDIGDAISIGTSLILEKKSKKQPDEIYTYGYSRLSVLGGFITVCVLLAGSIGVIFGSIQKLISPTHINYDGMILFSIVGIAVNFLAAYFTHGGKSFNQKAVNLHMLEDVLGWCVVLTGAIVMKFTDFYIIDPVMSIGVAVFILINAFKALKGIYDLFMEKIPQGISVNGIRSHLMEIEGIEDVHHIHVRTIDGDMVYATMHIVSDRDGATIKEKAREELAHLGISHTTIETEKTGEKCGSMHCHIHNENGHHHCHHHYSHHH